MSLIFKKIVASYHQNLPFVCFNKPNATKLKAYFGEDASLRYSDYFKEEGFVFAPFHNENPSIVFLKETSEVMEELYIKNSINTSDLEFKEYESDKNNHIALVLSGIDAIKSNSFKKSGAL